MAITRTNGDLAISEQNRVVMSGLPSGLSQALHDLNDKGEFIDDVVLTENGRYLILYGNNGIVWNDIPYSLERKLREYNESNEVIISVTFNDTGDWIVITKNYYSASDSQIRKWLREGNEEYGMLWSVCITDDALVAVFANGYPLRAVMGDEIKLTDGIISSRSGYQGDLTAYFLKELIQTS